MVRIVRNFMNFSNKDKVNIIVALIGLSVVIFMLMKLINMFKKSLSKENSFKGTPSKLPFRSRTIETSMARTRRRANEPSMARTHRRKNEARGHSGGFLSTQGNFTLSSSGRGGRGPYGPISPLGQGISKGASGSPPCDPAAGEIDNPFYGQGGGSNDRKCLGPCSNGPRNPRSGNCAAQGSENPWCTSNSIPGCSGYNYGS